MAKLYEITGDILKLQEMFEDETVDQEVLADTLEGVEGEFDDKIESYCKIIKNLESDIEGYKAEAKRLSDKKKSLEKNIENLKANMFNAMKLAKREKIDGKLFKISIQKNGGVLPIILDVDDTSKLPDDLVRIKEEADLEKIRALLEKGKCKYAHFGERGESLRIK